MGINDIYNIFKKQEMNNSIPNSINVLQRQQAAPQFIQPQNNLFNPYRAIAMAETGNEADPWIRTKAKGSGSSAFGEVQITRGLVQTALNNPKKYNLDDYDMQFLRELKRQQDLMLKYGGRDMKKGFEIYDYGQKGNFTADMIPKYRKAVSKILNRIYENAGKSKDFWRIWRFGDVGAKNIRNQDKRYESIVTSY